MDHSPFMDQTLETPKSVLDTSVGRAIADAQRPTFDRVMELMDEFSARLPAASRCTTANECAMASCLCVLARAIMALASETVR